jgi:NADP-dependent 3-hydroxy acid dehydrogenase YdfG
MHKTVVITGASSGIGAALAKEFVARGYDCAISARRLGNLVMLEREIREQWPQRKVHVAALDVTDYAAVFAHLLAAQAALGSLGIVIVNAGLDSGGRVGTGRFDADRAVIETNVLGAMATCDAAVTAFRQQGWGQLAVISSVAAFRGLPGSAAYSASKAAIATFADAIRTEVSGTRIKVTTLYPGFIDTPMNAGLKSRPFLIDVTKGAYLIANLIERGVQSSTVPAFPWSLVARLLKILPTRALARTASAGN